MCSQGVVNGNHEVENVHGPNTKGNNDLGDGRRERERRQRTSENWGQLLRGPRCVCTRAGPPPLRTEYL